MEIYPRNGEHYSLENVKESIEEGVTHTPFIECNVDSQGNHQLYQVYFCVDSSTSNFIDYPIFSHGGKCSSKIEFSPFSSNDCDEF